MGGSFLYCRATENRPAFYQRAGLLFSATRTLAGKQGKPRLQVPCNLNFVGVGGIEPPLQTPHVRGLPLPHTPMPTKFVLPSFVSQTNDYYSPGNLTGNCVILIQALS